MTRQTDGTAGLLRYLAVRPVNPAMVEDEWAHWIDEVLDPAARARLQADLELPDGIVLHAGYYELLPDAWKARFADWLEEIGWDGEARFHFPHEAPAWTLLWPERLPPAPETAWWLHFTDAPEAIAREGFVYGIADPDGLALTRLNDVFGTTRRIRPDGPGYIFAYPVDGTLDLDRRAGAYGTHAVLFRAPAVRVHHAGDRETQAIAHGPDVPAGTIRDVIAYDGGWQAGGLRARRLDELLRRLPDIP